jgi:RNA polymerase sigma-70 factor (sigma-E family)
VENRTGAGFVWEGVDVIPEPPDTAGEGARTRGGDFDSFVDAASLRLLKAALLLTGDHGRAEDLVQDALARAFLRWDRIVDEDPMAYVRRSMLNAYVDWWRRRPWREQPVEALPERITADDTGDRQAEADAVLRALDLLSRRERAVVVLRYYDDLSEAQIAHVLAMPAGTVKSTASRALGKLRQSPHLTIDDGLLRQSSEGMT